MKRIRLLFTGIFSCGGLLGTVVLCQSGCQSQSPSEMSSLAVPGMIAQDDGAVEGGAVRGAAETWSATCIRCHNSRSPASYSDAEWDIAMLHMRIQANLTADEYRTILEFLKASN